MARRGAARGFSDLSQTTRLKQTAAAAARATGVSRAIPCGVGWVWEPERFTAWQTDAVAIASDAARRARPAGSGEIGDVQVAETADHLGVHVWTTADVQSDDPALTVILRKDDLEVVRVEAGAR